MKAAVITMHSVCNYGTQLQAYATQEKLKQYFDVAGRKPRWYDKKEIEYYLMYT